MEKDNLNSNEVINILNEIMEYELPVLLGIRTPRLWWWGPTDFPS